MTVLAVMLLVEGETFNELVGVRTHTRFKSPVDPLFLKVNYIFPFCAADSLSKNLLDFG